MTAILIDASVALKWVLDEDHSDAARALFDDAMRAERLILAPPIWLSETTNAIYQRQRRQLISKEDADSALTTLRVLPVDLALPAGLHERALDFARRFRLQATYDAEYLAAASMTGAEFWTADRKLYRALPRSLRWVHWIGDYTSRAES
ncbi:MAG: PIN domain-containing protein [Dehalococcoidia bacterium]|nr:MAG: PIN domain-containing protein [Dehalococcoidia bacterium]